VSDEHTICALKETIARLQQKSEDDDKALVLAEKVNDARWLGWITLAGVVGNWVYLLWKH
jgi:hypothetical protein